ncbi:6-bladed beta-propeller [Candidatus Palauibacter sp.]|uniref:6-bladed beta-propeller n=1 Tax=Candidatus Palauibacter sp. TaxID=3101350 RepID=UPI003B52CFAF
MRIPRRRAHAVVGLVLLVGACGGEDEGELRFGPPLPALARDLTIGLEEEDPHEFEQIEDIEVDSDGNMYILDGRARRIAVFDREGRLRIAFGREGEGPGEFVWPHQLAWIGEDLAVVDRGAVRISVFHRSGALRDTWTDPLWQSVVELSSVGDDLLAVEQRARREPFESRRYDAVYVNLVRLPGEIVDTVATWVDSSVVQVRYRALAARFGGPGLTQVRAPYGPRGVWDSRGPEILHGFGNEYRIHRFVVSDGRAHRAGDVSHDFPTPHLSAAERDSIRKTIADLDERFDLDPRMPIPIPRQRPTFDRMVLSGDGTRVWLRTFRHGDPRLQMWDVHDCDLAYLGSVSLPREMWVYAVAGHALYTAGWTSLDIPYVARYRVPADLASPAEGCPTRGRDP